MSNKIKIDKSETLKHYIEIETLEDGDVLICIEEGDEICSFVLNKEQKQWLKNLLVDCE